MLTLRKSIQLPSLLVAEPIFQVLVIHDKEILQLRFHFVYRGEAAP